MTTEVQIKLVELTQVALELAQSITRDILDNQGQISETTLNLLDKVVKQEKDLDTTIDVENGVN